MIVIKNSDLGNAENATIKGTTLFQLAQKRKEEPTSNFLNPWWSTRSGGRGPS